MTLLRFRPTCAFASLLNMQPMTGVLFFLFYVRNTLENLAFGCHTKGEFKLAAVQTKQTEDMALLPESQGTTCLSRPAQILPPISSSRSLSFPLCLSPVAFGFRSGWASWSICACLRHWTVVDVGQSCKSCVVSYETAIVTSGDTAKSCQVLLMDCKSSMQNNKVNNEGHKST